MRDFSKMVVRGSWEQSRLAAVPAVWATAGTAVLREWPGTCTAPSTTPTYVYNLPSNGAGRENPAFPAHPDHIPREGDVPSGPTPGGGYGLALTYFTRAITLFRSNQSLRKSLAGVGPSLNWPVSKAFRAIGATV
jgi:hypothetical protein